MSVGYILRQAGAKIGQNPQDPGERLTLLRFLNEAARELYVQSDMPGSLQELTFKINGDQTVTMPMFVGRVRAAREAASQMAWHFNQIRPRYNQFNWTDAWRNYRLKNKQALMATVVNESVGVITVPEVEDPPIIVSLSGPITKASLINEQVVMDATSKSTVNQFKDYTSVKKDRKNNFDVTLSDVDGKLLTVIPNNQLVAQYQILDVSAMPWLPQDTSVVDNYVELLYKIALPYLSEDDDEFPGFDYDDIIVNKMMQLWKEEQDKVEGAQLYDGKATRSLARLVEEQNRETEDMIALVSNPHDTLLRRIGIGLRRRYRLFGGRRF